MKIDHPKIICFGEALVDRLGPLGGNPEFDQPVQDHFGGAPANVACALAKLSVPTCFVGRLGEDLIGQKFQSLLKERGLNLHGLQIDNKLPTRIVLVRRDDKGERFFEGFVQNPHESFADEALDLKELINHWPLFSKEASWLLIGTIPLANTDSSETLRWCIQDSRKRGIKIALDINWRPKFWDINRSSNRPPTKDEFRLISSIFKDVSLFKLAREEAILFFQTDDPILISRGLPLRPDVVITDGASPIKWFINGNLGSTNIISPPLIVDTTGAGDAFTAGLLYQLLTSQLTLNQEHLQSYVQFAAACGAFVCTGLGAIDPQPSLSQLDQFLSNIKT